MRSAYSVLPPFSRSLRLLALACVVTSLHWTTAHAQTAPQGQAVVPVEEQRLLPAIAAKAEDILMRAMALIGTPYHRGGRTPEAGFDCSGFVGYLFREAVNLTLPRSAREIWRVGSPVEADELEPGDLVFFNTMRRPLSHVGIFIGDGKFIHAPASGGAVRTESMSDRYWSKRWNGARRIEQQ